MYKKIVSLLLSICMVLSFSTDAVMSVFAEEPKQTNFTYEYDGYSVNYSILSTWQNNQTIKVVIKNTSDSAIKNWGLQYKTGGEIKSIWNADVYKASGDESIIKCKNYNCIINPGSEVNFGYNIYGEDISSPTKFTLCNKPVDNTQNMEVNLHIANDWGAGFIANVTVKNTSGSPVETWQILLETNFEIDNIWNAKLCGKVNNFFAIESVESNHIINPGNSITFGLQGRKTNSGQSLSIQSFKSSTVVVEDVNSTDEPEEPKIPVITLEADKDTEADTIAFTWESTINEGMFVVYMSEDNENFHKIYNFKDINSYTFTLPAKYENLYFYVKQIINGQIADSNIIEINNENGVIDWNDPTDSDGDGISDVYETQTYLTDPNKADTDGDGLEDGIELFYFSTDPTKVDTDGNGINDGDEDSDKDGLSNATEIKLGTDPFVEDSDSDTLKDGDEVNKHNTDPTKYDTDGDGISDADEIALGLDPNATYTDGVADNQKATEQVISADSDNLKNINGLNDNPYDVSLEIKAAGLASSSLSSRTSSYSEVIKSDAVIGIVPEFTYSNDLNVEDVVIKFKIDDSMVNNTVGTYSSTSEEFKGIKRINVFKYFEEYNMLLPIETFHDTATNTVYTHVDELGTYCLMDMEIWLDSIGFESNNIEEATIETSQTMSQRINNGWSVLTVPKSDAKASDSDDDVSVVYIVDVRDSISETEFTQIKKSVRTSAKNISTTSGGKAKFRLITIGYKKTGLIYPSQYNPNDTLTNIDNFLQTVDALKRETQNDKNSDGDLTDALQAAEQFNYENGNTYFFTFIKNHDSSVYSYNKSNEILSSLVERKIDTSIISQYDVSAESEVNGYAVSVATQTNGMLVNRWNTANEIYKHVYNQTYTVLLSSGLTILPGDFGKLSSGSSRDYDKDGLLDISEINFKATGGNGEKLIKIADDGTVTLPTFEQCNQYIGEDKFYVVDGLHDYMLSAGFSNDDYECLLNMPILPIISDPTNVDGDGDGYCDFDEVKTYNSDALKCDVYKFSLLPDFVPIIETNGDKKYGGNQGWYNGIETVIENGGCGIISLCDVLTYLDLSGKYSGITGLNTTGAISQQEYMKFIELIYQNYLTPIKVPQVISNGSGTWGSLPNMYADGYKSYMLKHSNYSNVKFKTANVNFSDPDNLFQQIENKIENGYPVPMFIEAFSKVTFYNNDGSVYMSDVNYHWVTITETERDDVTGEKVFHIASWGKEYIVKYDNWYNEGLTNNTVLLLS